MVKKEEKELLMTACQGHESAARYQSNPDLATRGPTSRASMHARLANGMEENAAEPTAP